MTGRAIGIDRRQIEQYLAGVLKAQKN